MLISTRLRINKMSLVHLWLKHTHGKANKCENPECKHKSTNFDWALIAGKEYEKKRENFKMLCRSCHRKYDIAQGLYGTYSNNKISALGWIRYNYGAANKCTNQLCDKKSKRYAWYLKDDKKYEHNINNFEMLCQSCGTKLNFKKGLYEKAREAAKISGKNLGNKYGPIFGKKYGSEMAMRMGRSNARLSLIQIRNIRIKLSQGILQSLIAKQYKVDRSIISSINTGRSYSWVI